MLPAFLQPLWSQVETGKPVTDIELSIFLHKGPLLAEEAGKQGAGIFPGVSPLEGRPFAAVSAQPAVKTAMKLLNLSDRFWEISSRLRLGLYVLSLRESYELCGEADLLAAAESLASPLDSLELAMFARNIDRIRAMVSFVDW